MEPILSANSLTRVGSQPCQTILYLGITMTNALAYYGTEYIKTASVYKSGHMCQSHKTFLYISGNEAK
jgi:hypothetical protein